MESFYERHLSLAEIDLPHWYGHSGAFCSNNPKISLDNLTGVMHYLNNNIFDPFNRHHFFIIH